MGTGETRLLHTYAIREIQIGLLLYFSTPGPTRSYKMESNYDVLIIGSGSAGLAAGVWLSQYLNIRFKILEKRTGPLEMGQADGVQCRMVEICESFDLADTLLKEGYWVNEVAFWAENSATARLERTGTAADTPYGLSHQPHLILNQARINQLLIEKIGRDSIIDYGVDVQKITCSEPKSDDPYCVGVVAQRDGKQQIYRAKYVIVRPTLSMRSFHY
jgi:phenol 2-monooxygenase